MQILIRLFLIAVSMLGINQAYAVSLAGGRPVSSGINTDIYDVLNTMYNNISNSSQQQLTSYFVATSNLDDSLHNMIPITNVIQANIWVTNSFLNKAEARIAALRDSDLSNVYTAGDVYDGRGSVWMTGIINGATQGQLQDSDGYNALTGGVLLGLDTIDYNYNVTGFGVGYAYTKNKQYSNAGFTNHTDGYYAVAYGTRNWQCNNYLDWLLSGNFNTNEANRAIYIAGSNLSTSADYFSYLLAARLVRGKAIYFLDSYKLTPLTFLQYSYASQDAYDETGSVAALHIAEQSNNIVTLGGGFKFAFPTDAWKCVGMMELRTYLSYDVLNNKNNTVANFIAGSSTFTVTNNPSRFGVQLGAGFTYCIAKCVDVLISYDLELRHKFTNNTGLVKIRYNL